MNIRNIRRSNHLESAIWATAAIIVVASVGVLAPFPEMLPLDIRAIGASALAALGLSLLAASWYARHHSESVALAGFGVLTVLLAYQGNLAVDSAYLVLSAMTVVVGLAVAAMSTCFRGLFRVSAAATAGVVALIVIGG